MYNVLYGSKSIVVDNEIAADLIYQAHTAKKTMNSELAVRLFHLAIDIEEGILTAAEALNLANPVAAAA